MKKILLFLCLIPVAGFAQNLFISARAGLSNYQGDLQGKGYTFKKSKFIGSLGAKYDMSEHIQLRGYLSFTKLGADDKDSKNAYNRARNLNFTTGLQELELSAQYNIFSLNDQWWTPYVFAGIGIFHYKPYTTYNGNKVYLQPLSTEGEGVVSGVNSYKLTQFAIPFGIGGEYALTEDIRIGLEFGYRKTFTDYIDDASKRYVDYNTLLTAKGQTAVDLAYRGDELPGGAPYPIAGTLRANSKKKDAYYFTTLTITFRPFVDQYKRTSGISSMRKAKKRVGCPAVN
ncbi:MAG: outer membrane beta-barrel protein [Sphingobacteriales bacterium]|nr:outer membrane beta-barrel protein [Sphingobacteriales bacterium]MBI3718800.1 outer membrane beta-barrel protein [Sphingobacteriales bacterium]